MEGGNGCGVEMSPPEGATGYKRGECKKGGARKKDGELVAGAGGQEGGDEGLGSWRCRC